LVEYVAQGVTLRLAAANFSVTPKTAAKWVYRFRREGPPGLWDRSSRTRRRPRRTSSALAEEVIALRRHLHPAYRIAQATQLSAATVSRILQRAHLNRWRHLHPAPPVVRYEHPAPGDLLHLDIKAMTRYQSVSIRGDGRRRGRPQFAGWQALHIAIDDHSRLAFSRLLPNQTVDSALAFYAEHGISIRRLLTDNGSCYRSHRFRSACEELGIRHRFTALTLPAPTVRPNASSKPLRASGPMSATTPTPKNGTSDFPPGSTTTTSLAPIGSLGYAPPISRAAPKGTTS
jgi:transposase InsO family protein